VKIIIKIKYAMIVKKGIKFMIIMNVKIALNYIKYIMKIIINVKIVKVANTLIHIIIIVLKNAQIIIYQMKQIKYAINVNIV